ncbi:MAG TPA: hypothetical protein VNZ58_00125 [Thermomicrobiales bacterium]|nr:hypothetical protein [Thermomicrobiales bacterium]
MANPARILERLRHGPPTEMALTDVETLIAALGWTIKPGTKHSLKVFPPSGDRVMIIPSVKGRTVKQKYLRDLLEEIERSGGI